MPLENLSPNNTHIATTMVSPAAITEIKRWAIDDKEINVVNKNNKAQFIVAQYGRNTLIPAHDITGIPNGLNLTMLTAFLANTWVRLQPISQGEYTLHINQRLQGGGNIIGDPSQLWPESIVPYQIDENIYPFEGAERQTILEAIDAWNQAETGFQFVHYSGQKDVLIFGKDPKACYSQVGCQGGKQYIFCSGKDVNRARIMREIGHAIGFYHEQQRYDRDQYVTVPFNDKSEAYRKLPATHMFGRYDFGSIMHRPIATMAGENELAALIILPNGAEAFVGQAENLSLSDIAAAKQLYQLQQSILPSAAARPYLPSAAFPPAHIEAKKTEDNGLSTFNDDPNITECKLAFKAPPLPAELDAMIAKLDALRALNKLHIDCTYLSSSDLFLLINAVMPASSTTLGETETHTLSSPIDLILSHVTDNNIVDILQKIKSFNPLHNLTIFSSHLTALPAELGQLSQLHSLTVDAEWLRSFPAEITQLHNLQSLTIHSQQLISFPAGISQLKNLQNLSIFIGRLPHSARDIISIPGELGRLAPLKNLMIHMNGLTSLPAELGYLNNLQNLTIIAPKLISLPPEIGRLSALQRLVIEAGRDLRALPTELSQLSNLQDLTISTHYLSLPVGIGRLNHLQNLTIKVAKGSFVLPVELSQLNALQELTLDIPKLTALPAELGQLTNLQRLIIHSSKLLSFPAEIEKLLCQKNVTTDVSGLTDLPSSFDQLLPHLTSLRIDEPLFFHHFPKLLQLNHLQNLTLKALESTDFIDTAQLKKLTHLQNLTFEIPDSFTLRFRTKLEQFTLPNTNITMKIYDDE